MHTTLLIIHILCGSLLFGGGLLTCLYYYFGIRHATRDLQKHVTKKTLQLNLMMIAPCGIIQLITGFILITQNLKAYDTFWLLTTIVAFGIATFAWLIGLQILYTTHHQEGNHTKKQLAVWAALSLIAFISIGIMIYVMSALTHIKP